MKQLNIFGEIDCVREKKYIDQAREAITLYDPVSIDLQHLLAVLIGPSATGETCGRLSSYGIRNLAEMTVDEFQKEGLSKIQAKRLVACFGLAKKLKGSVQGENVAIHSSKDAAEYLNDVLSLEKQEKFYCLYLNTKNKIIYEKTVFIGSLNASIVHPREVYKEALRRSAASVIVAHNHPSGDPTPSREDINVTKRLVKVGEVMGIECLDHIIIGDGRYVSLKELGYM